MSARGLAGSATDKEQEKGRVGQAAVKRYWPGKAPDWYKEKEEQPDSEDEEASGDEEAADVTAIAPPVVIKASEDPRLRRLAQVMLALIRATSAAALNAGLSSLTNSHIAGQVAKSTCMQMNSANPSCMEHHPQCGCAGCKNMHTAEQPYNLACRPRRIAEAGLLRRWADKQHRTGHLL